MATATLGRVLGEQVCVALGLEPRTVSRIVIDLAAREMATVTVERFVMDDEVAGIVELVEQYKLVPVDDEVADDGVG